MVTYVWWRNNKIDPRPSTLIFFNYSLARKVAVSVLSKPNQVRKLACSADFASTKLLTFYIPQYVRCSAVDAAATLTHNVEKAFQDQEVLTALAFDIEGAFNRVTDTRLI